MALGQGMRTTADVSAHPQGAHEKIRTFEASPQDVRPNDHARLSTGFHKYGYVLGKLLPLGRAGSEPVSMEGRFETCPYCGMER
jgi:hypothetical protein